LSWETALSKAPSRPNRLEKAIAAFALTYPAATRHFPWGDCAIKVKGKAFLFMSWGGEHASLSVKLPYTRDAALAEPYAKPMGYGLGKNGWVSFECGGKSGPGLAALKLWIDESYRAVAPAALAAQAKVPKGGQRD
jgi:predicted DNA-binding protein (MmcQ/YjbR family)